MNNYITVTQMKLGYTYICYVSVKQEARQRSFPPPFDAEVVFFGCSALHYAVLCNNTEAVKLMYKYGERID